jgi:O-6-methylguanine DNA methyltransferase
MCGLFLYVADGVALTRMIEVYIRNLNGTWFGVALQNQRIAAVSFAEDQKTAQNNVLGNLPADAHFQIQAEPSEFAKTVFGNIKLIYDGEKPAAELQLATTHLTAYREKVLKTTMAIPIGYVSTYGAVAEAVGGGPRAVGNIMAGNPYAPIVPCHRVVKSDFGLGGYGGGLRVKVALLRKEKRGFSEPRQVDVDGKGLKVYPVEYVLDKLGLGLLA